jgi:hypothetical protein
MLLMQLILLPFPTAAADPTWPQQMVAVPPVNQVCFPPVGGSAPVCVDRLARGTARDAGHFCAGHFAARLPQEAFCAGGGCLIEADQHRVNGKTRSANLINEKLLPVIPYGESWVYGSALRGYGSAVHACGKAGKERDDSSVFALTNSLSRHLGDSTSALMQF